MRLGLSRLPDLIAVLQRDDRAAAKATWTDHGADRYVSTALSGVDEWQEVVTASGATYHRPLRASPLAVGWIRLDIDDLDPCDDVAFAMQPWEVAIRMVAAAGPAIEAACASHPNFTGEVAIVATSMGGFHVLLRLRRRWHADGFRSDPGVQRTIAAIGQAALDAIRACGYSGGKLDANADPIGLTRRPGLRRTENGGDPPWVVRLAYASHRIAGSTGHA